MTTTPINEPIEQKEKQKADRLLDELDLRDYFAAKAMTTMFYPAIMESIRTDVDLNCDKVADFAYTMADAMLSQREKS
jgi:hypothetical protein